MNDFYDAIRNYEWLHVIVFAFWVLCGNRDELNKEETIWTIRIFIHFCDKDYHTNILISYDTVGCILLYGKNLGIGIGEK